MKSVSCLNPRVIFNKYLGEYISVPCGKCAACTTRFSYLWTKRLEEECACHAYTLFLTLTYHDVALPKKNILDCDLPSEVITSSLDFVNYHDGFIPCVSSRDLQLFFKRLRKHLILENGLSKENSKGLFRYFVTSEYGPTTFRPHYHMLLWFDSPSIAATIKKCIYKSWKLQSNNQPISLFFKRNQAKFVSGYASQYVAGYLNCSSHLPSVLRSKPFRTFHLSSIAPPIGSLRILSDRLRQIFDGYSSMVTLESSDHKRYSSVPLWCSLENKLFPKCLRFASLSDNERLALYRLSSLLPSSSPRQFVAWFSNEWYSQLPVYSLVRRVCGEKQENYEFTEKAKNSLIRAFYVSRKFSKLCKKFSLSPIQYLCKIKEYYSRKEYASLLVQLELQQYMSEMSLNGDTLSYYPYLVDDLFYSNLRDLKPHVYEQYLKQFNLSLESSWKYTLKFSSRYQDKYASSSKIRDDNTKVRIKKDFVASHPEFADFYKFNVFNFI